MNPTTPTNTVSVPPLPPTLMDPIDTTQLDRFHAPLAGVTNDDRLEFEMRHGRVKRGLNTFYEVGFELEIIRDKRLYRAQGFPTFDDYCRRELAMTARYASYLWVAADIVRELAENNCSQIPETASQARPLAALSREKWALAWTEACTTAPEGKLTAKHVQAVVSRHKGPDSQPQAAITVRPDPQDTKLQLAVKAMNATRELQAALGTPGSLRTAQGLEAAVKTLQELFDDLRARQEARP